MTKILGYTIFNKSMDILLEFLTTSLDKLHIISGNPDVLYNSLNNPELFNNFTNSNAVIIPDGAGVVLASKLVKAPVTEKIAGIELMDKLVAYCEKEQKSIYLLGAEQSILSLCNANLTSKYKNLIISGSHNGFFDLNDCQNIIDDINKAQPYALFIAMGCPRQEMFVSKYFDKLNCHIFMGVGGSFDVFAGKVQRAPKWMIKNNLEWLYRVIKEPFRIKRLSAIPKFLFKVLREK